jgi:poly(beta-D-mannuronate) C5 epimerase
MAVFESPCTIVGMNDVSGNNRAGIKVRNSWDVLLLQNLITGNKGSAVEGFISDLTVSDGSAGRNFVLDPYQPVAGFSAIGNAVDANGAGIQAAGVSQIELYGNQFRNQSDRLVAGDLEGLQGLVLQEAERKPTLISTNCRPVLQPMHACPFIEAGLIGSSRFSTSEQGDFCLGDSASPQAEAFSMVQQ